MDAFLEPEKTRRVVDMLNEWNIKYTKGFYDLLQMPMSALCSVFGRVDDKVLGPERFDEVFWPAYKRCIDYAAGLDTPPILLVGKDAQRVYDHVIGLRQSFGGGLILAVGCQAPPNTAFEAIEAFSEAARTPNF